MVHEKRRGQWVRDGKAETDECVRNANKGEMTKARRLWKKVTGCGSVCGAGNGKKALFGSLASKSR